MYYFSIPSTEQSYSADGSFQTRQPQSRPCVSGFKGGGRSPSRKRQSSRHRTSFLPWQGLPTNIILWQHVGRRPRRTLRPDVWKDPMSPRHRPMAGPLCEQNTSPDRVTLAPTNTARGTDGRSSQMVPGSLQQPLPPPQQREARRCVPAARVEELRPLLYRDTPERRLASDPRGGGSDHGMGADQHGPTHQWCRPER